MKKLFKALIQQYLKILTKIVIWRHKPMVIAIAGTTNKTFIKEVILDELGRGPSVRGNPKSFNTEIGLPLAVLFLPSGYSSIFKWVDVLMTGTCVSIFSRHFPKVLVLEMGVDRKGDMKYLLSIVKPTVAVVTNVIRNFPDTGTTLDDIAVELGELVKTVPEKGSVILNGEDVRVKGLSEKSKAKVVFYGTKDFCNARISDIETMPAGQKFVLSYDGDQQTVEIEKHGRHNINAHAVASIVSRELESVRKSRKDK